MVKSRYIFDCSQVQPKLRFVINRSSPHYQSSRAPQNLPILTSNYCLSGCLSASPCDDGGDDWFLASRETCAGRCFPSCRMKTLMIITISQFGNRRSSLHAILPLPLLPRIFRETLEIPFSFSRCQIYE